MLAPPAGSKPLPRWARGPLLVPCKLNTPAYMLQDKTRGGVCIHALPHFSRHWTPTPYLGGLWDCHMFRGSGPHPASNVGSGATTCHMAPNPHLTMQEGSSADTHPMALCGPWVMKIKKGLVAISICYRGAYKTCRRMILS
jgi:hypothetical protein